MRVKREQIQLMPGIRVELVGRRKPITWITYQGITDNAYGWGRRLGVDSQVILHRLRTGRTIEEALDPRKLRYQRPALVYQHPPALPEGVTPELAAVMGLIDADEYLDCFREPRRPWSVKIVI